MAKDEQPRYVEKTYYADNEYGIPKLNLRMQAVGIERPVVIWGDVPRGSAFDGTFAFYTHDYKFSGCVKYPEQLLATGCRCAGEVNFSTSVDYPRAHVLKDVFVKRWVSCFWQEHGVKILVDVNVAAPHWQDNLIGVPVGWRAYISRSHRVMSLSLHEKFERCCDHAQSKDVLFVVVGGGQSVEAECREQHWVWIPERLRGVWNGRTRQAQEKSVCAVGTASVA